MLKIKAIFISLVVLVSCSSVATTKKESDALLELTIYPPPFLKVPSQ